MKTKTEIFAVIYKSMLNGINMKGSTIPREWLMQKGLSIEKSKACFNSGQIHHRKPKEYLKELENVGLIKANGITSKNGDTGYTLFGKYAILFPLRNKKSEIVNFYAIRIAAQSKEEKFLNDEGIYPAYPHEMTKQLFITTDIIDTATLLETKILDNRQSIMCIPNGKILPQHEQAIGKIMQLESIVWIQSPEMKLKQPLEGRVMPDGYTTKTKKKDE